MNPIAQTFIRALSTDSNVQGVILFGSQARGNAQADSDFDLIVLVESGNWRSVETFQGRHFELIWSTLDSAFAFWSANRDDAASLWEVARIVYDRDGMAAVLAQKTRALLAEGKPALTEDRIAQLRFDAEDQLKRVNGLIADDPASAAFLLESKVAALTGLQFDLRRHWTPAPKQRLAAIREINPTFHRLLQHFYVEAPTLDHKLAAARRMIPAVFDAQV